MASSCRSDSAQRCSGYPLPRNVARSLLPSIHPPLSERAGKGTRDPHRPRPRAHSHPAQCCCCHPKSVRAPGWNLSGENGNVRTRKILLGQRQLKRRAAGHRGSLQALPLTLGGVLSLLIPAFPVLRTASDQDIWAVPHGQWLSGQEALVSSPFTGLLPGLVWGEVPDFPQPQVSLEAAMTLN